MLTLAWVILRFADSGAERTTPTLELACVAKWASFLPYPASTGVSVLVYTDFCTFWKSVTTAGVFWRVLEISQMISGDKPVTAESPPHISTEICQCFMGASASFPWPEDRQTQAIISSCFHSTPFLWYLPDLGHRYTLFSASTFQVILPLLLIRCLGKPFRLGN